MSLRQYLILTGIGVVTSWVAFSFVLIFINPETTNLFGFIFFYLSLFFALATTFGLVGFIIRSWRKNINPLSWQVKIAFRQGFFFAVIICAGLWMLANNLFSWLNIIILIITLTILEFLLINKKNNI